MNSRGRFGEKDAAVIIKQILTSLNVIHMNNIVHRDVKPENIMLEDLKRLDQIKLYDFGVACRVEKDKPWMSEKVGTPYYIAPEVLSGKYTSKCDIWSAGVIAYMLLSGKAPFTGSTEAEILKNVQSGTYDMTTGW